ncbi:MAG: tail fiber domain-containing protein [Bacteroidales bacterium]|nr:MAG: tail fiber domain-containing protein [Bacteroidales bacterium]
MKRFILFLFTLHCSLITLLSQAPQGFNYQAVARDDAGEILANTSLDVKIGLLAGSAEGTLVWEEEHSVSTNSFGLFTLVIGDPSATRTGGTASLFPDIDWGSDSHYLKVEIDDGSGYQEMGAAKLMSVPYALFAENAEQLSMGETWLKDGDTIYFNGYVGIGTDSPDSRLEVVGDGTETSEDALFEVKRNDGQTVFAVYPEGVRIYVDDSTTKGTKGGFAVGGFNPATKGLTNEYLRITPDSVRVWVNDDGLKGTKGGFAVGGFSPAKGYTDEYLRISPDSVRIYVRDDEVKGTKGGFAVGGFTPAKGLTNDYLTVSPDSTRVLTKDTISGFTIGNIETGSAINYLHLTPKNYFIGHESGESMVDGLYNVFIGYQSGYSTIGTGTFDWYGSNNSFIGYMSGYSNTYGHKNIFIGNESGFSNTTGYDNVFIGARSGYTNTTGSDNIFIGKGSGESNTTGAHNYFIGSQCGTKNTEGDNNAFIGHYCGYLNSTGNNNICMGYGTAFYNTTGSDNIYIGHMVAWNATTGNNNTFLGSETGYNNTSGYRNTYLGYKSGYNNTTGNNNVFLGYLAGSNETGSNKLYIESSGASSTGALIYGDFSSNYLRFNGNVGVSVTPSYKLDVNGTLNIRRNAVPALYVSGYEAIWCDGTYFSWGYGGTYNAFADKVIIGGTFSPGTNVLYVNGNGYINGTWSSSSDRKFKQEIMQIEKPLEKILKIHGVNYRWKVEEYNDKGFPEGRHYGVIAQDVEKVLPEIVLEHNGEKAVAYNEIIPVLIEAVKEQQALIENQQAQIEELDKAMRELMEKK